MVASIDPDESPELARKSRAEQLALYARPGTEGGWHFLTGTEPEVARLAKAIGFSYRYDAKTDKYAHPGGFVIATPQGSLSRYLFGITFRARDVRLALVEASQGKIGSPMDVVHLRCFQYDPATGQYGFAIMGAIRIGGILTVLALMTGILIMLRRERPSASDTLS